MKEAPKISYETSATAEQSNNGKKSKLNCFHKPLTSNSSRLNTLNQQKTCTKFKNKIGKNYEIPDYETYDKLSIPSQENFNSCKINQNIGYELFSDGVEDEISKDFDRKCNALIESETNNDADDEKDCSSIDTNQLSLYEAPKFYKTNKGMDIRLNFKSVTEDLFDQLESARKDAETNRVLVNKLSQQLENLDLHLGKEDTTDEMHQQIENFHNSLESYKRQSKSLDQFRDNVAGKIDQIEDAFNIIQRVQSDTYMTEINKLKMQLVSKDKELADYRENYSYIRQWIISMFKELGEYSKKKCSTDNELKVTIDYIQKRLKKPNNKSDLINMYRYLMVFLYQEESKFVPETQLKK